MSIGQGTAKGGTKGAVKSGANRSVRRNSVSSQVADIVRDMILVGELPAGQAVTHLDIADRLGVSTMPVREALLRLTHEGFIEVQEGRSFRISTITRRDIEDLYWIYRIITGELAARACRNDPETVATVIDNVNSQWRELPEDAPSDEFESLSWTLHRAINDAADSPKLAMITVQVLRFLPHFYTGHPVFQNISLHWREALGTAMHQGQVELARAAMEGHANQAAELMIPKFTDKGHWASEFEEPKEGVNSRSLSV